jgi:hypothetical protein
MADSHENRVFVMGNQYKYIYRYKSLETNEQTNKQTQPGKRRVCFARTLLHIKWKVGVAYNSIRSLMLTYQLYLTWPRTTTILGPFIPSSR